MPLLSKMRLLTEKTITIRCKCLDAVVQEIDIYRSRWIVLVFKKLLYAQTVNTLPTGTHKEVALLEIASQRSP